MENSSFRKGVLFAAVGFSYWGFLPLYWRLLGQVDPLHILGLRILLSLVFISMILASRRNSAWLTVFKDAKKGGMQILASLFLCVNWGIYVWAVNNGRTIEGSLGYYINPLVSIVLGLIFFREKLNFLQWAAFGFACLGVLLLTLLSGTLPWISITLALTFGFYGLLKKTLKLSALESLGAETLAAAPLGLLLLPFRFDGGLSPDWQNLTYLWSLPVHVLVALALIGLMSTFPLYCFGKSAKLLPLSTLGFIQFLSPTIQFFLGYFVFGEVFPAQRFAAFALIWLAVILYIVSLKSRRKAA